jgi:hypothetical protein
MQAENLFEEVGHMRSIKGFPTRYEMCHFGESINHHEDSPYLIGVCRRPNTVHGQDLPYVLGNKQVRV